MTITADEPIMLTNNDVLLGRGGSNCSHTGNQQLRDLAKRYSFMYLAAPKREKQTIASLLVQRMHQLNPRGRFLRRDPDTGGWQEVSNSAAREKTSQCLRDAVTSIVRGTSVSKAKSKVKTDHEQLQNTRTLENLTTQEFSQPTRLVPSVSHEAPTVALWMDGCVRACAPEATRNYSNAVFNTCWNMENESFSTAAPSHACESSPDGTGFQRPSYPLGLNKAAVQTSAPQNIELARDSTGKANADVSLFAIVDATMQRDDGRAHSATFQQQQNIGEENTSSHLIENVDISVQDWQQIPIGQDFAYGTSTQEEAAVLAPSTNIMARLPDKMERTDCNVPYKSCHPIPFSTTAGNDEPCIQQPEIRKESTLLRTFSGFLTVSPADGGEDFWLSSFSSCDGSSPKRDLSSPTKVGTMKGDSTGSSTAPTTIAGAAMTTTANEKVEWLPRQTLYESSHQQQQTCSFVEPSFLECDPRPCTPRSKTCSNEFPVPSIVPAEDIPFDVMCMNLSSADDRAHTSVSPDKFGNEDKQDQNLDCEAPIMLSMQDYLEWEIMVGFSESSGGNSSCWW